MSEMKVYAHKVRLGEAIELAVSIDNGVRCFAQPMVFEPLPDNLEAPIALRLTPTAAQMLMDELWDCGVRPTQGTGSAGALAATERHLRDMRAIAMAHVFPVTTAPAPELST